MKKDFVLDRDFSSLIEEYGEPTSSQPVTQDTLDAYQDKLPSRLLEYWQHYGFCGFNDGYFWLVNPADYAESLAEWLTDSGVPNDDQYYVIARSAYGELYVWSQKHGIKYKIDVSLGWIIQKESESENIANGKENDVLMFFFGMKGMFPDQLEKEDEHDKPLFERCKKQFGPLNYDEMYTFEPALFLGGEALISNMNKVDIFVQLSILASFGHRELLDTKGLMGKAF